MILLDLGLGFVIGLILGLLGGGGSILTVPALVYLVGQSPQMAVTASLAIVGINSGLGAWLHGRHGALNGRIALIFGGSGMITSYLAAGLSKQFAPEALMVAFAGLMLVVGWVLVTHKNTQASVACDPHWAKVIASGAGVGLLTGVLGVGGGFLIVPTLVMVVGLPFHQAIGTSLLVITMNSLAGFMGHLHGVSLDLILIALFVMAGLVGTLAGSRLARHLDSGQLRQGFALMVIALSLFLLADNLPKLLI